MEKEITIKVPCNFVLSLEAFLGGHRHLVYHLEHEITNAGNQKVWDAVINYAELRRKLRHIVVRNRQVFQYEYVVSVYNWLSYHWQKELDRIMTSLFVAFDAYRSGSNYQDLIDVYSDYILLIEIADIEQREKKNVLDWLVCRFCFWVLKLKYRRWNQC